MYLYIFLDTVQLNLEQQRFELYRSIYMWILLEKYSIVL